MTPPTAAAAAAPEPTGPTAYRARFVCPSCGRRFSRKVRLGIYAHCPSCGGTAYGDKVYNDLAGAHAAKATTPRKPRPSENRRGTTETPSQAGSPSPRRAPRIVVDDDQEPDDTPPAAPPVEPRRPGFLSRILGTPEDDE